MGSSTSISNVMYRFSGLGDQVSNSLRTKLTKLIGCNDQITVTQRGLVILSACGTYSYRGDSVDERQFSATVDGAAMGIDLTQIVVSVVHVSIEVDDVEGCQPAHARTAG